MTPFDAYCCFQLFLLLMLAGGWLSGAMTALELLILVASTTAILIVLDLTGFLPLPTP